MDIEIERKFLVKGDFKCYSISKTRIVQTYLSSIPERNVRIRISGDKAYLTIKGISDDSGIERMEWEKEIDLNDAKKLMEICEPGVIDKTRYIVPSGELQFEVDVFHGENEGLIIAEIELEYKDQEFYRAKWLGDEVTGDLKYYNSYLKDKPFLKWEL